MDVKKQIKSFLNQAEIYKAQGLLTEAAQKYLSAGKLIQANASTISNHKSLLTSIARKIKHLKEEIAQLEKAPAAQEMSEQVQEIIRTKFAFAKDSDAAELEGALALAKFGQYQKAIEELKKVLGAKEAPDMRLAAAKNLIRCYAALDGLEEAAKIYQNWLGTDLFPQKHLESLRAFFQQVLDRKSVDIQLPEAPTTPESGPGTEMEALPEEEILDISSVGISLTEGTYKGQTREYDISFQSGNVINLLIPDRDREMLEMIEPDVILEQVQFYSPIAMFEGKAMVVSKSQIESGPKQGSFSVDIKVMSI